MTIDISIIVPIYNAAQYVESCVNSILAQTFTNFELLLIDDGSTDESLSIIERLAKKDSRIRIFTQKNKGVSLARNIGLINAKGKYIGFVDADDTINIDMYQVLHTTITTYNLDLINSNLSDTETFNLKFDFIYDNSKIQEDIIPLLLNSDIINSVCTKLYKIEIIKNNNLSFNTNLTDGEDNLFNLMYFNCSRKVLFINYNGYNYKIVNGSATNNCTKDYFNIIIARYNKDYTSFLQTPVEQIQIEKGKRLAKALISSLFIYKTSISYISKIIKIRDLNKYLTFALDKNKGNYNKLLFFAIKYRLSILAYFLIIYSKYKNNENTIIFPWRKL